MRPRCGNCPSASTSARTQLASCPCKSRCVTLPCELLWRIPASELTLRSCRGSVGTVACDPVPAPVPQISLAQALDVRLSCGFVPCLTSMLRSIRGGGGASRPARRVQADLGEGHEPACHLRPQHVCLHLAHPSTYGAACPYLPFGCRPSRQCVVSMRRTSRPFLTYTAPPARRGRRIHAVRELWQGNRPARTKMPLCWQDVADMRSRALDDGKMLAKCVSQRPTVTGLRPDALLGDWQWQYSRAMRSRGSCRGKIPPRCVPGRQSVASFSLHASKKWPRTGKSPVRDKIRAPCIRKRAGFGRICAPCIRKALQTAVWEYTARRSCHEGPLFAARAPRIMHGAQILPSSDAWPFGDETSSLKDGMLRLFRLGGAGSGILV